MTTRKRPMSPEPMVIFEGQVSDESEHAGMLANETANAMADEIAIDAAISAGLTRKEAEELILPSAVESAAMRSGLRLYNKPEDQLFGFSLNLQSASLLDFWKWAFSDLCDDDLKGIFAEWMLLKLLDIPGARRVSWANSDLVTREAVRIEVKATAYWQSWKLVDSTGNHLATPSRALAEDKTITFHGLLARDAEELADRNATRTLKSDIYVFAFQHEKSFEKWNAMDLSQWEFYVVPAKALKYRSISLRTLRSQFRTLNAIELRSETEIAIASVVEGQNQ